MSETFIEEILFIIKENAVLLAVIAFIIFMIIWGYRKGLMAKLLSLCSVVATLFIEMKVYPIVLAYIKGNEAIISFFSELGNKLIMGALSGVTGAALNGAGTGSGVSALDAARMAATQSNAAGSADVVSNAGSGGLQITSSPLYELLGLDVLADNAAMAVGDIAIKIICFIIIFIVIRLLVKILAFIVRGIRKIHFIRWFDGMCGGVLGFAEGILYVWIFMFIISGFPTYSFCSTVLTQISRDALLTFIYNQNLIMQFFAGMLK